jgi:hypothetical protein
MPGFISFQGKPNEAAWKFKVISITVEHGDPIKITVPVAIRPVATETPVTTLDNLQYSGTVSWSGTLDGGKFAESTAYTATIALTAKTGYTFDGIDANTFPVTSATSVTHVVGTTSLSITAVFPETKGPAPTKDVDFTTANVTGPGISAPNDDNAIERPTATVIKDVTATEYSVESYGKYDTSYTYFTVTFATGVVLSDYSKISFTVETISGSITYKAIYVLAYATGATLPDYIQKSNAEYLIASEGGNALAGFGNNNKVLTLALGSNLQKDSNSIIVAINVPCDNTTKAEYKIKNVKFYN